MGGLFNPDNTFFRGMSKLWDMLFVSILWAICSLPGYFMITLVTSTLSDPIQLFIYMAIDAVCMVPIGPATSAIYYVCMKVIRRDRGYVFHEFVYAFKLNFKVGAISGAILGALVTLLSFNLFLCSGDGFGRYDGTCTFGRDACDLFCAFGNIDVSVPGTLKIYHGGKTAF